MKNPKKFFVSGFQACLQPITRQCFAKWSGGFAVVRMPSSSNGFHHYWIEPNEGISTVGPTVRGRGSRS